MDPSFTCQACGFRGKPDVEFIRELGEAVADAKGLEYVGCQECGARNLLRRVSPGCFVVLAVHPDDEPATP